MAKIIRRVDPAHFGKAGRGYESEHPRKAVR